MSQPTHTEANHLPATEMVTQFRRRQLSPVEVVQACLATIDRLNPILNAFNLVAAETAIQAARESEQRWMRGEPLGLVDGVPASVKDIVLAQGWPTLRGSRTVDPDQEWTTDSPVVARLRENGAILMGRTTTPEMGWKGITDSPLTGITRNPWNPDRTPGGSSGGAAVAAATGMATLNVGTDGGGSVRIPASFTGIVGHKPSYARIPAWPPSLFGTISHIGPMTRTVADAALMLQVTGQNDIRDWTRPPYPSENLATALSGDLSGLVLGYARTFNQHPVDPEVADRVEQATQALAGTGARLVPVDLPFDGVEEIFRRHWHTGAAMGVRAVPAEKRALMDPGLLAIAEDGERVSLATFQQAMVDRSALGVRVNALFAGIDALIMPTLPLTAFEAGHDVPPASGYSGGWPDWTPFTPPFNLTQQPAASVPCGFDGQGLPVGLQVIGRMHDDATVLRICHVFEQVHPPVFPDEQLTIG